MPRRGLELTRRIALCLAALLAACAPAGPEAQAVYLDTHVWSGPRVGGISGIELAPNGVDFLALSDRAVIWQGRLDRREGRITGLAARPVPLLDRSGAVKGGDTEGLAVMPDGRFAVSFEGTPQVLVYDGPGSRALLTAVFPRLGRLHANKGLEALAVQSDGTLIAITEGANAEGFHGIWRFSGGRWRLAARLAGSERYEPTGADFGPDGALYLLERRFSGLGFQSRVRRIILETGTVETLLTSGIGEHDNLEGLSVWRDASGALRLTMVSDDNFNRLQRTEIVEYRLDGTAARP